MIAPCDNPSCQKSTSLAALYQNERYGDGRRVHTESPTKNIGRCTVCSTTRSLGGKDTPKTPAT